ncbi:MAG: YolD-like protein [Paenibacillus sp.]|nr:YolD-like protein [Paenibacillus sp.]
MSKKLEDNGLWESSRMMLPEHKERIIAETLDFKHKRPRRPVLDEQEWEEIMRVLMESLGMRVAAHFKLYHEYEDCAAIGIVDKVDPYTRTFIIDGERFKMGDIIGAHLQ